MKPILLLTIPLFALTGCLSSETASLTTTQGSTSATVDANPGISKGQTVAASNASIGAVVNLINGNGIIMSLPASGTGTATATFTNTKAMQFADDVAGLKAFGQTVASTWKEYSPQLVALANNAAGFAALVQQITSAAGLTPETPSQSSVYVQIENGAKLAATSITALNSYLDSVQQRGTPVTTTN